MMYEYAVTVFQKIPCQDECKIEFPRFFGWKLARAVAALSPAVALCQVFKCPSGLLLSF